jgi:hypothetical protein
VWDDPAVEDEEREVLAAATFSVFAPEGLPVELSGWGGGDGEPVDMVGLRHAPDDDRWLDVDSEIGEDDFDLADAVHDAVEQLGGPSDATDSRPIPVDGVDVQFGFASAGDRWVAIGANGDVTITVQARGMSADDLRLRSLADPARLVEGGIPEYRPARAGRRVLDPRRVAELAQATPIEDLGATLAGLARGGLALLASEGTESSWIGGEPHLPADAHWPRGAHGAMTFVAQLTLADLDASVWTGPTSGHLHVFCDVEPDWACAILHTPAGVELTVHRFPSDLHEDNRVPLQMVRPSPGLTLPDEAAPVMRPLGLGFGGDRGSDVEELWRLEKRLRLEQGWHRVAGRLLGWPTWQNDDNMANLPSQHEWTLLLQTDALDAELYVVLPTADLAAARFDRAEAMLEYD